jgi:hypothetical protein
MRFAFAILALFAVGLVGFEITVARSGPRSGGVAFAAENVAGLEDFMLVVHGPKGLLKQIQETVGAGSIDDKAWKSLKADASIMSFLTDSILQKSSPSKGDKASWKSKVGEYAKSVKALAKGAGEKDASALKSEVEKLKKSCEGCHKAHR